MKNTDKNIDNKISEVDVKLAQLQAQIKQLDAEKAKLVTEKELAKRRNFSKEEKELVKIRELVKENIDKYNDLAKSISVKSAIGLLTSGGHLLYELDENNETAEGEYFSDDEYGYNVNKYPSYAGWYPSSLSC